jgi:quinoprotein glucose dehydrogenase
MRGRFAGFAPALLAVTAPVLLALGCAESAPSGDGPGAWPRYGGDEASTRYAPLAQIHAGNFGQLEVAWTWKSPAIAWKRSHATAPLFADTDVSDFQVTPLVVGGVLYGVTSIGQVFALDAGSGSLLWLHDPRSYDSAREKYDFIWPKHRGVTWWRSGDDERIFLPTIDAWLLALDARTGEPVGSFGDGGRVDLLRGLRAAPVRRLSQYFQSSPAALYGDVLIVGSSINDRPRQLRGVPGDVRGYDARTGEQKWAFHVVPAAGEPGAETWEDGSFEWGGSANAWGLMSVDSGLGLVYVPTSTPHNDLYGGHRPGDNLYAETLLALDAETGERVWHQQLVRHGLWDYDLAAAPVLADIVVEGREIPAVVQVTKQAFAFVFDRRDGTPVWPIEDRAVPGSDVPGEVTAATQRFPTRPPPFDRQGISEEDLVDFTPELHAEALEFFRAHRGGPVFTPPSLTGTIVVPGGAGGTGWHGAAFDPRTHVLYVPSITQPSFMRVVSGESRGIDDMRYVTGLTFPVRIPFELRGGSQGLPLVKPPYSRITAIDLDRGEILWQVPNGDGPRKDPRLARLDLPPLGSGAPFCVLVTDTLLLASGGSRLLTPLAGEPVLRAFDKETGALIGEIALPGRIRGCPMTYLHRGRQLVAMAVARNGDPTLLALALPEAQ